MIVFAALRLPTVHWKVPGTHTVLDFKEIAGIAAGLVVVILLVVLFILRARTARLGVKKLLSSPNPLERIAGIKMAATEELGRHVRALRRLSGEEHDPRVLKELAEVVARHQWEPSDDADIVELRIWAHRYYSDRAGEYGRETPEPVAPIERTASAVRPAPPGGTAPAPARVVPSVAMSSDPAGNVPTVEAAPSPSETIASFAEPEAAGAFTVLDLARRWGVTPTVAPEGVAPKPVVVPEEAETPPVVVPEEVAPEPVVVPEEAETPPVVIPEEVAPEPVVVPEEAETPPLVVPEEVAPEPVVVPEEAETPPVVIPEEVAPEPVVVPEEAETPSVVIPEEVAPEPVVPEEMPQPFSGERPCILVTGAGGAAGVTVIQWLVEAGHRVVAVDSDPLAVGLRLAQRAQMVPSADDPQFSSFLCKLAIHQGAKAIISTVSEEMPSLADHRVLFHDEGVATWFPERGVVQACIDKWLFYLAAKSVSLPVPPTNLGSAEGVPGPWIVKPRFGRGSRDIMWADTREELDWALGHVPNPLVQSRLTGREFTVDALVARDGSFAGGVARWRLATRGGITTQGETFANEGLLRLVADVLRGLAVRGPANVQGFASPQGNIMFTEVNPRFSGGLALSLAAGADLVGQYLNGVFERPIDPAKLRYRPGVRMLRYFNEVIEG